MLKGTIKGSLQWILIDLGESEYNPSSHPILQCFQYLHKSEVEKIGIFQITALLESRLS